jgi:hypothetical protein
MRIVHKIEPNLKARTDRARLRRRRFLFSVLALSIIVGLSLWDPDIVERPLQTLQWGFGHNFLVGSFVIACLLAIIGAIAYGVWTLAEGRKRIVLYLRHFGFTSAHETVSLVMEAGLSRRYRIVTLDDASFRPLEVPKFEKRLSRYGPWIAVLVLWVTWTFGLIIHYMAFIPVLLYLFGMLWFFTVLFVSIQVHRGRIRRRSRLLIEKRHDIRRCLIRIASLASFLRGPALMAPQVTVVRVATELWQGAVVDLSKFASAVIIDVSVITQNLLWELEFVLAALSSNCVLIGQPESIRSWTETKDESAAAMAITRAQELLHEKTVLTYTSGNVKQQRAFRHSLTTALDNVAQRPRMNVGTPWWERLKALAGVAAVYGLIFVLITIIFAGLLFWLVNFVLGQ